MTAPPSRARAWFAAAVGVAALAFLRLRPRFDAYGELVQWLRELGTPPFVLALETPALLILAALAGARCAAGPGRWVAALGLTGAAGRGLLLGALIGLPMLLQAPLSAQGLAISWTTLRAALLAPFAEELFFRGLFVAVLVRVGGFAFWPTAILAGVSFGAAHVPWSSSLGWGHLPTFLATTAGGIWYGWLLRCYDWNLWLTVSLHATMNLAWAIFAVAEDAAGGLWPNVGRALTIALGTVLALRHRRARGAVTG